MLLFLGHGKTCSQANCGHLFHFWVCSSKKMILFIPEMEWREAVATNLICGATRGRGRAWSALGFDNLESVKIRVGDFSYCIASLA